MPERIGVTRCLQCILLELFLLLLVFSTFLLTIYRALVIRTVPVSIIFVLLTKAILAFDLGACRFLPVFN